MRDQNQENSEDYNHSSAEPAAPGLMLLYCKMPADENPSIHSVHVYWYASRAVFSGREAWFKSNTEHQCGHVDKEG